MNRPADSADVRRANLSLVLRHIEAHGPCARTEIAAATGLVHASVTALVADLVERRLVEEAGAAVSAGRGRPRRLLRLVPERVWTVAVQVNRWDIRLRVADLAGSAVLTERASHQAPPGEPELVAEAIAQVVARAIAQVDGVHLGRVVIAVPGPVVGGLVAAAIPFGWGTTDLAALVTGRLPDLQCPVEVVNDANMAALAEYHALAATGSAHPDTVAYVRADVGVGGGLLIGGRIHAGSHGMAGEIGHIPVSLDGPPCKCGSSGCLVTYLGLGSLTTAAGLGGFTPGQDAAAVRAELDRRLRSGEPRSVAALHDAGHALGAAMLAVASAADAGAAILGGYLADWAPWLAPGIDARLTGRRTAMSAVGFDVSVGVLGADATLHGAVQVGRDRIFDDPTTVPTGGGAVPATAVHCL
ncbi:ROK family transcriptional regulator [Streptomyces sp. NPDC002623]|uniref:ROK family transcriptional regulator n=1 Tax=unclassified Streptomyces TaxID=2593676 RepID=UPI0033295DB3